MKEALTAKEREVVRRLITYKEMDALAEEYGCSRATIQRLFYKPIPITRKNMKIYKRLVDEVQDRCLDHLKVVMNIKKEL